MNSSKRQAAPRRHLVRTTPLILSDHPVDRRRVLTKIRVVRETSQ